MMKWVSLIGKTSCIISIIFMVEISVAMDEWESWPIQKLENEMSPSRWNPHKNPDQVIQEYVQVSIEETDKSKKSIPNELNVPYGEKSTQQYDIYGTNLPNDAPVFFWIHGGYWQEGSKDISGLLATNTAAYGIRNIVLGYTLAPNATVGEILTEMLTALRQSMKKYPNAKFIVGGHSAGGQLSAMLLHEKSISPEIYKQLAGLILVSGVYDLRPLVKTYINTNLKMTSEDAENLSPLRIQKINPEAVAKVSDLQILLTVGTYDSSEFQRQATEYYNLLKSTFPKTELWKSPSDDHFTLVQNMAKLSTVSGKQFKKYLEEFTRTHDRSGSSGLAASNIALASTFILTLFSLISFI